MDFEVNPFFGLLRATRSGCPRRRTGAFHFAFHLKLPALRSLSGRAVYAERNRLAGLWRHELTRYC